MKLEKIIPRSENFADWYTSVIKAARLVDYSSIKGMMIFEPNGWAIWQHIMHELDRRFKAHAIKNVQLPLFIRSSEFIKEKEHVEGFAPEVFQVTKQGDKDLEESYVIRPTSEITFCNYFKSIIHSYNDLPIKLNQWCNVYRAEKTTRPFLRTSEFFWQELHSVFDNEKDTKEFTSTLIKLYYDFVKYYLCIPTIMGEKTIGERFAGAENTYTLEAIMQDGQALQCATSHYLGQNFSKVYDVNFQTNENKFENVYQMSAGISTRIIGAIIMSHADDKGLMLPIGIAPTQIALLPVLANKDSKVNILVEKLYKDFHTKYRTYIDNSNESFGYKVSQQEVEGTPIIIVVGPKEANEDKVTLIRRDNDTKATVSVEYIINNIDKQIHNYQLSIYEKAEKRLNESIIEVKNIDEFNQAIKNKKIIKALWGGDEADEKQLKIQTSASPRCIDKTIDKGTCFFTNKPAKYVVYFGRAY